MDDFPFQMAASSVDKLYRYRRFDANELRLLFHGNQIRYADPNRFNDPWDCHAQVAMPLPLSESDWDRAIRLWTDVVAQGMDEETAKRDPLLTMFRNREWAKSQLQFVGPVDSLRSNIRVLCLSGAGDVPLMWSHYANGHTGICLVFPASYPPPTSNTFNQFASALQVHYSPQRPIVDFPILWYVLTRGILTKPDCFSYEREYRMLASDQFPEDFKAWEAIAARSYAGFVHCPAPAAVILGARISPDDEADVRKLAASAITPVEIWCAHLINDGFGVEVRPDGK
jgi:hypothetical protein